MEATSTKINIAFVAASTVGGGAERMQINIINTLPPSKYDIYFINTSKDPKPQHLNSSVEYIGLGKTNTKNSFYTLKRALKQINPDYIFTTSVVVAYLLVIIRFIINSKAKLFVRIAVPPSESQSKSFKSKVLRKINEISLKRADLIIAQTEFSKEDIHRHYKVPLDKIRVIRNITDTSMLENEGKRFFPKEYKENQYSLVAAGALYSVKGFDLLIKAMADVVEQHPTVCLYILGEVRYELDYKEKLQNLIKNNNLTNHVFLLGHKQNPYPYFKYADMFVLSSRTEGFPNVVLEALHYGTPVIATNCVDFTGVIYEGINGYVVDKNSVSALYDGIVKGVNNLKKPSTIDIVNFNYEELFI